MYQESLSAEKNVKTEKEAGEEWSIWYLSMEVGKKNLDEWSSWCSVIHKAIGQQLVTGDRDSSAFQSFARPGGHNKNSKEQPQIVSLTFPLAVPQRNPSDFTIWQPVCYSFLMIEAAIKQHLHSHDLQEILLKQPVEENEKVRSIFWCHNCTWGPFSTVCIQGCSSTQGLTYQHSAF